MGDNNLDIPEEDELNSMDEMMEEDEHIDVEEILADTTAVEIGWDATNGAIEPITTIEIAANSENISITYQNPILKTENGDIIGGYLWYDTRDNKLKTYDQNGNVVELAISNNSQFNIVKPEDKKQEQEKTEKKEPEDEIENRFDLLDL